MSNREVRELLAQLGACGMPAHRMRRSDAPDPVVHKARRQRRQRRHVRVLLLPPVCEVVQPVFTARVCERAPEPLAALWARSIATMTRMWGGVDSDALPWAEALLVRVFAVYRDPVALGGVVDVLLGHVARYYDGSDEHRVRLVATRRIATVLVEHAACVIRLRK